MKGWVVEKLKHVLIIPIFHITLASSSSGAVFFFFSLFFRGCVQNSLSVFLLPGRDRLTDLRLLVLTNAYPSLRLSP